MVRRVPFSGGVAELCDEGSPVTRRAGGPTGSNKAAKPETVVLLHGFTGSKDSWTALRRELSRSRRVISLDLPGHGGTRVEPGGRVWKMEGAAAMIVEVLNRLGVGRFSLIGYSMGGRVALFAALSYPERVASLVLESASAGLAGEHEREKRRASDEELAAFIEKFGIEAFVDRWEHTPVLRSLMHLPHDARVRLRRQRLACCGEGLAASLRGMGTGSQPYLGDRLRSVSVPALIVAGALDHKFAGIGQALAGAIPDSRLGIVEDAGHTPHLESPAKFNRMVLNFLGREA